MGWQDDARKTIVSEKKLLTTMDGYWVKVRKYSIKGKDEIDEALRQVQKGFDRKALYEVAKTVKGIDPEKLKDLSNDDVLEMLTPEQFSALTDATSTQSAKVIEAQLKHGIESHNFCDGDIETRSTDKDIKGFASQVLEYPEIAGEILAYVEEFNRPLANETSRTSGMSPNGSTTEASSSTETSSPTDGSQPD